MLTKEELTRYSRQIFLPEIGKAGQEKLKQAKVLIVGAGGLGCPALQYLAAGGVGKLGIVDADVVEETNLQRQILYSTADLGKSKALIAARKIAELNPHIETEIIAVRLNRENADELFSDYDIAVDCSDNFETRYIVNDAAVESGKPFVYGGIYKFEGQVSVFNYQSGPDYRNAFPETHPATTELDCSLTGVIATLPGIIGLLQANEVIKIVTGIGRVCSGKILVVNALTLEFSEIKIKADGNSSSGDVVHQASVEADSR